ncbi:UDP-glycosyltransferase 73C6 [Acorus calamus]|uniref:UDP-glycosyltransferase 73C6 n=1 Tax=Acorus calamus TaxID=4465 RepID=A0AAV9E826_ACOCL|nr:UDP-glycosyltransferase 73C6 [Acorus calamus]
METPNHSDHQHFLLCPFMAQGHMIPMVDMAILFAQRGVYVSFITTALNASRVRPAIDHASRCANLPIRLVELRFLCAEAGLPEGYQNIDAIPHLGSMEYFKRFFEAIDLLKEPLERFLGKDDFFPPPTCVISDKLLPFTQDIARGVGRAVKAEAEADGVVVNSFDELEAQFIEAYVKMIGKKAYNVGPLSLCKGGVQAERGNKLSIDQDKCLSWLDSHEPGSVVYVSFGSIARLGLQQAMEIGEALKGSGRPVVWVIKSGETESWVSRFGEGLDWLVIVGWAPQVAILSHKKVGGFVTHCGWNLTVEALCAGVAMVMWPRFAEQFMNERVVVEVLPCWRLG